MTNQEYVAEIAQNADLSALALNAMGLRLGYLEELEDTNEFTEEERDELLALRGFFGAHGLTVVVDNEGGIHWLKQ